jgi:hypothetical protein
MTSTTPLHQAEVLDLAEIINCAHNHQRVGRIIGDRDYFGTARHVVKSPDNYGFPGRLDDVRDCYLRVTLDSGMDVAWPVSDLLDELHGLFFCRVS